MNIDKMTADLMIERYNIAATDEDCIRIRRSIEDFFNAVQELSPRAGSPKHDGYIQLYHGEAIRSAFKSHVNERAIYAAVVLDVLPDDWGYRYRASVAYHLAPIFDEVINS